VNLTLYTERLILTPLTPQDMPFLAEMRTDPLAMRYIGGVRTLKSVYENADNYLRRSTDGHLGGWCVSDRETGENLGTVRLRPMPIDEASDDWDEHNTSVDIDIGYLFKPAAWGKGYGTETVARVVQFCFQDTAMPEIVAVVDEDNPASRHLLEKSGFRLEGPRKGYGKTMPGFRITRQMWLDQQNMP